MCLIWKFYYPGHLRHRPGEIITNGPKPILGDLGIYDYPGAFGYHRPQLGPGSQNRYIFGPFLIGPTWDSTKKGPKCSIFAVYLLRCLSKLTAKIDYFDPFLNHWTLIRPNIVQKGSKKGAKYSIFAVTLLRCLSK